IGWYRRYGPEQKAHTEEDQGEHHAHQRTSDGYLDLICRLLREGLQIGDTAYRQKRYAVNLDAKALSYQGVAELVQQHAEEQGYYCDDGCEGPEWATRCLVADEGKE